jgi:adenylylsulfate kinase
MLIVYLFFGDLELAVATVVLESSAKILLYWWHEKIWQKIRWGREKIEPFNLWFTGLPLSGKTTIADLVYKRLKELDIPLERIDSRDVRELFPEVGYSREDRIKHIKKVAYLIRILQKNSISTVCSFVSPYREARKFVREMVTNNIVVYIKSDVKTCQARDYKGVYEKAIRGEIKNFTGISDIYEEPKYAEIVIDTREISPQEAVDIIVDYVKKSYIK